MKPHPFWIHCTLQNIDTAHSLVVRSHYLSKTIKCKHMKTTKISIYILIIQTVFLTTNCQNKSSKTETSLTSIDLLRGDITLCGSGQFGEVSFSLSCDINVQESFDLAISLLHSFEYEEAEKAFAKVIDVDPNCAMAYWGVAMCNFHALWRPPRVDDLKKGSLAIKIARSLKEKTERETQYIEAIASFYNDWDIVDHHTRIARFENAMETMYNTYPADKEAAIFYALALNSAADLSDKTYKNRRKAGKILEGLLPNQPNHPGITHYIIHSYDYPELASMALSAARNYASMAPASSHAQHMPSHIFTRLGLWEESIQSNLNATSSAQCYAEQVGMDGNWDEEIHGTDYLVYAYLQIGKINEAKKLLEYLKSVDKISPIGVKAAYPSAAIPARLYLETRQWDKAAKLEMPSKDFPSDQFPWSNGIIHFVRVLGAVHNGNIKDAKIDLEQLNMCYQNLLDSNDTYMANQVMIMKKSAEAWIRYYEGNKEQALNLMTISVAMESNTEKHSLTPGEVVPAQELLGDLFMKLNKPSEALKAYELNLKNRPNRFNGVYGAAVSAKAAGDEEKAYMYFQMLLKLTRSSDSDRPELEEAREFVGLNKS